MNMIPAYMDFIHIPMSFMLSQTTKYIVIVMDLDMI